MTGSRIRRLLGFLLVGAIVVRVIRGLRGSPTRTFDRPVGPARPAEIELVVPGPVEIELVEAKPAEIELVVPGPVEIELVEAESAEVELVEPVRSPPWSAPVAGACPDGYPIKANLRSGIFHLPGMSAYERTSPDRCYANAEGAEADGLRIAKR
ncbi:MAG: hypothetical protein ABI239_01195 [Aquihabitans sp.]